MFPYCNNYLTSGCLVMEREKTAVFFIDRLRYYLMKIFLMAARMRGVRKKRMKVSFSRTP